MTLHGYVTAELTYGTTHMCHVPAWPWAIFVLYKFISPTLRHPLWLLPAENKHVCHFYSSSGFLAASLLVPCIYWVQ